MGKIGTFGPTERGGQSAKSIHFKPHGQHMATIVLLTLNHLTVPWWQSQPIHDDKYRQPDPMASQYHPIVSDGTYSIRSANENTYLKWETASNNVVAQQNTFQWTIAASDDGDYEIRPSADVQRLLCIDNLNQLCCSLSGPSVTWTIEPRGSTGYVIGNSTDTLAIQLPIRGSVTAVPRNNGGRQRWILEPDPLGSQSILNSLQGTWSVTWRESDLEAMVTLQESNGVLQGQGVQTSGARFTVRATVSGNTAQFQINVFHPTVSQNSYTGIISADRRTIDTPWGSYRHLLGSQSNSLQGAWSVTWPGVPNQEAMVTLQESNGILQGQGIQTSGSRFTVRVTVSGNTAQFQINVIHPSVSQNNYDGTISADWRTINTTTMLYRRIL